MSDPADDDVPPYKGGHITSRGGDDDDPSQAPRERQISTPLIDEVFGPTKSE